MKSIFDKKGIALLMVISALMVLTTAIVEFAYTNRIYYQLAVHNKEQLQAYYLAKSAINFSKLLLKYNKQAEQLLEKAGDQAKGLEVEPIYRMFPLSSGLLRGIVSGEITDLPKKEGEEAADEDTPKEEASQKPKNKLQSGVSFMEKEEAEKFLNFDGDFALEITEEQTKFNLNWFFGKETTNQNYDRRKKMLLSILLLPKFEDAFDQPQTDAVKLTHALSDWVDSNNIINEFDGTQRGSEDGIYKGVDYEVKNGKYLSLSELRLVTGMKEEIYQGLKSHVTIYGKANAEGINACLAEDEVTSALIYDFTHYADCGSPVDYADDKKMEELVEKVRGECPNPDAMENALYAELGLGGGNLPVPEEKEGKAKPRSSGDSNCSFQFRNLLTKENKIFTVKGTGTVGETEVNIITVINTDQSDPGLWKYYYYRIE